MAGSLTCTVVSPERTLFEGTADHIVAPGWNGEMGIYRRHAPMLARLGVGLVRIHEGGSVRDAFAVRGGFLEVLDDDVRLLVTKAMRVADLDPASMPARLDQVRERLAAPETDEAYQALLTERSWLQTQTALLEFMKASPMEAMATASSDAIKSIESHKTHT